jgi:hypothetical protein
MKLLNSESPVFMNESISPVFQILGDDRRVPPRLHFIVHFCPSPIKQTTSLMHIPHIHDTFPIHFQQVGDLFWLGKCFQHS